MHYILIGLDSDQLSSFNLQAWITHYGARIVDFAQATSLNFITFMGGDLWIHNSDTTPRCNLFGEQKECEIGVVVNQEPTKIKILDSLDVNSDGAWEVVSLTIPATMNYPNGMSSKVPKEHFKKRSGVWRAKFLRNMMTNQATESALDLVRGEPLRGNEAYMVLRNVNNPSGEQVKLFKVEINLSSARV